MADWSVKDLVYWDDAIRERVEEFGLRCYPQEFEVCDHGQMLGYMAYHGMPAHYPHWSFGKSYETMQRFQPLGTGTWYSPAPPKVDGGQPGNNPGGLGAVFKKWWWLILLLLLIVFLLMRKKSSP